MPHNPDLPCAVCGKMLWRSKTSLPQGQATCLPCRRKNAATTKRAKATSGRPLEDRSCAVCGLEFHQKVATQVYCSPSCRESRRPNWAPHIATATERGYGKAHRDERAKWKPIVEAGQANCCLCGYWIEPGSKWHLDHTPDRTGYRGVAHAACNIRDGARRGAQRHPRPLLNKTCDGCTRPFTTIYPRQSYCTRECRPKPEAKRRTNAKPKQQRQWTVCGLCETPTQRRVYCSAECSAEANRICSRNQYRIRQGIPLDRPTPRQRRDLRPMVLAYTA